MLRRKIALVMTLAVAAGTMLAGTAFGHSNDRNHDRIPDRWEKRHHLSLKVKQGGRDQDHDGLTNRGEWRAKLNPRDRDTDNDGRSDGDEVLGANGFASDPLLFDTDGDGISDGLEVTTGSNPGDPVQPWP